MPRYFALVDCNNFYVSCERVFSPKLAEKPLVILSNNDGCVVSRSNEVKDLGIPMGSTYFEWKEKLKKSKVSVFSSNYALYGDMSQRIMSILAEFTENLEIYSIDEAFLDVSDVPENQLETLGQKIQSTIKQFTGIPVSIGIASTKTLAKVCNKIAKDEARKAKRNSQKSQYNGVFLLPQNAQEKRLEILKNIQTEDVWGIGRQSSSKLANFPYQILTAWDFINTSTELIKKLMGLNGLKIWHELNGVCSLQLDIQHNTRKSILSSSSFGRSVTTIKELSEALTMHITQASQALRKQKSVTSYITIFIVTKKYNSINGYYSSLGASLPVQSNYTPDILRIALSLLNKIFKPEEQYKKIGVCFSGLVDTNYVQNSLFEPNPDPKKEKIMAVIDKLNLKYGRNSIRLASHKLDPIWQNKSEFRSLRYTTVWHELLEVK